MVGIPLDWHVQGPRFNPQREENKNKEKLFKSMRKKCPFINWSRTLRRNITRTLLVASYGSQIFNSHSTTIEPSLLTLITLHKVRCWRCSSEVERLSSKTGERDPEFTPQHKERKDGESGITSGVRGWGAGHWWGAISMHEFDPSTSLKEKRVRNEAQWYGSCLAHARPWAQLPQH